MDIQLVRIDQRKIDSRNAGGKKNVAGKSAGNAAHTWLQDYALRISRFCRLQQQALASESALFSACERTPGRTAPYLVLLDGRGKQMTSEALASWLGKQQDAGTQRLIFAIGPADGWSAEARERANLLLSLGSMTLPHELAAVVLAEQVYRAFTILKGLPYHLGHR